MVDSLCANVSDSVAVPRERHLLYGLSGNDSSLFGELQVSLKSVVLNSPTDDSLTIHIITDQAAYLGLGAMFTEATQWNTTDPEIPRLPTQISIKTYNVEAYQSNWTRTIEQYLSAAHNHTEYSLYRHTIGAYFRLFAADVLPPSVDEVVYLDVDAVVMANVGSLWEGLNKDPDPYAGPLFYWGESLCSGFMVLRLTKQQQLWEKYSEVSETTIQSILRARPVVDDQFCCKQCTKPFHSSLES